MSVVRVLLAITVLWGFAAAETAIAGQKYQNPPRNRVIVLDRSLYGPPPPPHERRYVGPAPSIAPPMERVPRVAPLAQPPIR